MCSSDLAEKKALTTGADIIICTPGRFISHLNMGYFDTSGVKHFILDEADRMLDMGFNEDITRIAEKLPEIGRASCRERV